MRRALSTNLTRLLTVVTQAIALGGVCVVADATAGQGMAGDVARGATSWSQNCARCHEMRGPTEFRDDLWRPIVTHMRVRAGLTGQQQRDILAFLQASNTPPQLQDAAAPVPVPMSGARLTGKEVYDQTCIVCHGEGGTGAMPGAPDFTAKDGPLSKSDDVLMQHIIGGFQSPGSSMAMPAMGGNPGLNEADVRAVLGYLRTRVRR